MMSRDLILIAMALMTWGIGEGMFYFFQPLYLQQLGANPVMIGGILGLTGFVLTLTHLPAGYLADRIGRKPLLVTAWWIGAAATWIMALSTDLPIFVAGSVLYGATAWVISPLNSYVTAARGKLSVGRAITLISATYNVGAVVGPLLGGWLGDRYGLRVNFIAAAGFFLVSSLVILLIRPQPIEAKSTVKNRSALRDVLTAPFVKYLFMIFLAMFCLYLPQPLSQNFLQNQRGVDLGQMGMLISARGLGVVALNLILGQMNARAGYLLAQTAVAGFAIILLLGAGMPYYLVGYFLMGAFQTARSLVIAQGRSLVESSNMGLAYGIMEASMSTAMILAPIFAGLLYARHPAWIYSFGLVFILVSLSINLLLSPQSVNQSLAIES